MNRSELKTKAKKAISGKVFTLFAIMLIAMLVVGLITSITFGLASLLTAGGIMLATAMIYLGIVNKDCKPKIEDLMYGFKSGTFLNGFVGYLRYVVFVALWAMLLWIPGIVKALAYSMMFYIMVDNPKMDAGEAQKKSIAMMKGYKGDLFVLYLSFIPWFILCGITFGLAAIYVVPYVNATVALYYEGLKKKSTK